MEIEIDGDTDAEIAQAIATAVSEHLGQGVELVGEGGTLAEAGENWSEEGAVVTEREAAVREDLEAILSGGPDRGFDKIDELGKVFVRDRLDLI